MSSYKMAKNPLFKPIALILGSVGKVDYPAMVG